MSHCTCLSINCKNSEDTFHHDKCRSTAVQSDQMMNITAARMDYEEGASLENKCVFCLL